MFSLRHLLVGVAIAAIGSAALVSRSPYLANAIVTFTVGIAAFAFVRIYAKPDNRVFWVPALLVASTYCGFAFAAPATIRGELISTRLIFDWWYHERGYPLTQRTDELVMKEYTYLAALNFDTVDWFSIEDLVLYREFLSFAAVAHCLLALLLGWIGGAVTQWSRDRGKHLT